MRNYKYIVEYQKLCRHEINAITGHDIYFLVDMKISDSAIQLMRTGLLLTINEKRYKQIINRCNFNTPKI